MAFDVKAMRLYWKTMSNNQLRYVDLKDFDFSCQTGVEVLDVNAGDTGNVRTAFSPYTVAFNREQVTRIYSLYNQHSDFIGNQYSQDMIDGIIAYPESTICNAAD